MSVDTLGVRFSAEGSENILNLIKQITTATGQLDSEIKKLTQTSQQAASGIGPAFSNLGNAISSGEQKVKTLTEKFAGLQGAISRQGTAFGTATASIWGIYNAYDSLEKVQLRASQASVRVETLTTSLRSQEEQLRLAREAGNLTAEQLAVKQERIADTTSKLTVAQERQSIMQEDVNEAWAGFISLVGPQAIAAIGSISQLVAGLTMAGEGQVSVLGRMKSGFTSLIGSLSLTRTSGLALNSTFQQMPIFTQQAEVGVRGLSGALKGLLIGTGVGLAVLAIGLLIEYFDLLGTASADTAADLENSMSDAGEGTKKYSVETQKNLDTINSLWDEHVKHIEDSIDKTNVAYLKGIRDKAQMDQEAAQIALEGQQGIVENLQSALQHAKDKAKVTDLASFLNEAIGGEKQKRQELIDTLDKETKKRDENAQKVAELATANEKINSLYDISKTKIDENTAAMENAVKVGDISLQQWNDLMVGVDGAVASFKQTIQPLAGTADGMELAKVKAEELFKLYGKGGNESILLASLTNKVNTAIEELFPNEEKAAKATAKHADELERLRLKGEDIAQKFSVEVPEAFLTNEDALNAFGRALDFNKQKLDEFHDRTKFITDFSGLEKAFKIEFDTDKEVKDFIKDLPKETRKKVKLIIDSKSDWQGVQDIWKILGAGIFKEKTTTNANGETVITIGIEPKLNNPKDISNIADTMIDSIKDQFGKGVNSEPIKSIIEGLKSADTEQELIAAFEKWGVDLEGVILEDPASIGRKLGAGISSGAIEGLGPLADAVLNLQGGEGVTTWDPKQGKFVNTPREPKGDGKTDFSDETKAAQQAADDIVKTFLGMSGKLSNIWLGMAKNWSGMMNSVINNAKSADTNVVKEFDKMVTTAEGKFRELADNWSKMMNSMINNAKSARDNINKALDGIKDQEVKINVTLAGEGKAYLKNAGGAIHLAQGGVIDSAAAGQIYMTNGPQLVLIGDNPGGNEIHAMIPKNDPLPTVRSLMKVLGGMSVGNNSTTHNSVSNVNNYGLGSGPIVINVTQPIYLDSKLIGENISRQSIDNLDRFFRS